MCEGDGEPFLPIMPTQIPLLRRSHGLAFVLLASFSSSLLPAQTAPAPAAPAKPTGEAVVLSPFSVESKKDYGYRATNSITATGSGEAIINTPLSISILTEDFLKDKNLTELREALRFVPGTSTDYQQVFGRGFTSVLKNDGAEANGGGSGDFMTYNVERIEIIKGPVSVLQGRASAGGVVNLISRKPKFTAGSDVDVSFGSFQRKLGQFRTTGPLLDKKVAYLLSYTKLDRDGWVDLNHVEDDVIQAALELRPVNKLSITLNFEQVKRDQYPEQHLTFTNPAFLAAQQEADRLYDARGVARPAASPQVGETTAAWLTRTPGFGPNVPTEVVNVNELMYPRGFRANIQGSQAFERRVRDTFLTEVRSEFAPWLNWRSFYYNYREHFTYARQSTFRPVANIGGLAIADRPQMGNVNNNHFDTMHEAVSRFSTFGLNHRTLVGFEHREVRSRTLVLNGSATIYNPRTGGNQLIVDDVRRVNPNGFNFAAPHTVGRDNAYYFVDQMNAFDERLFLFMGGRQTKAKQGTLISKKFTPQYGAVVRVPGVDTVSVFGTYGESFRPNFIADGFGKIVNPTEEKNSEYGVKVDLFDSKISGSASIYEIEQSNVPLRDFAREASTGVSPLYNVAGLAKSRGAEFEMVITPMRNYQVVFGYSRIWEARTLVAQDLRQVGVRLNGAPEWTMHLWNKYTFTGGPVKGAYVGFGARFAGAVHVHPSWSAPVYANNVATGDILLGYPVRFRKTTVDLTLRVDNITNKFFFDQSFRPNRARQIDLTARFRF